MTLMTLHSAKGLEFPGGLPHRAGGGRLPARPRPRRRGRRSRRSAGCATWASPAPRSGSSSRTPLHRRARRLRGPARALALPARDAGRRRRADRQPARGARPRPAGAVARPRVGARAGSGPDPADEYPFRVGRARPPRALGRGALVGIQKDGEDVVVTVNFAASAASGFCSSTRISRRCNSGTRPAAPPRAARAAIRPGLAIRAAWSAEGDDERLKITLAEVEHVARLARLGPGRRRAGADARASSTRSSATSSKLRARRHGGRRAHRRTSLPLVNVMRDDEVRPCVSGRTPCSPTRPTRRTGSFRVPRILEE